MSLQESHDIFGKSFISSCGCGSFKSVKWLYANKPEFITTYDINQGYNECHAFYQLDLKWGIDYTDPYGGEHKYTDIMKWIKLIKRLKRLKCIKSK